MQVAIVLLLASAVQGAVQKENPVTKVVELIQELKAKIEADGKAEQKVYDKFACWCEKTTARKAGAIEEAKTSIEELSEKVLNLKGKTATLKAEIAQLEKDISGNIEGTKEATTIREKETADYTQERSDLEQAIGALERAIGILTGAGEKPASALQQAQILSVVNGVKNALRFAPSEFAGDDRKVAQQFVHDPMQFFPTPQPAEEKKASFLKVKTAVIKKYDPALSAYRNEKKDLNKAMDGLEGALGYYAQFSDAAKPSDNAQAEDKQMVEETVEPAQPETHPKQSLAEVKNPFGDYAPASGAIQGMLKSMYDSMTSDLESKNADQAIKQKQFEELTATKDAELKTLKETLEKKKETLGEDTKTMTDSEVERDETQAQLKADEKFFEETKDACKAKADDWAERSRLRTEELSGINKAIEILTSDEAQATFGRATSMFLQSSKKKAAVMDPARAKAFRTLKLVSKKHNSLRMAAVAALVQSATEGHFDVVIGEVDKLIAELRAEEQDDIDLRDYCQDAENKVENEMEDLQHKADNIQGLIDRLEAKKKEIQADIKKTESDIAATEDAMAEALSTRNSENEDFKAALKDDTDAVALLASAIDAMTAFSTNNKLPLGNFLQKKEDPEYAVDPDKAPETFSEPYGGRSSEGGGITSILSYIKEDLENEIGVSKKAEAAAQAEFEEQRAAATQVLNDLKAKKTSLEKMEAETEEKIADAGEDKEETLTRKENKAKYRESLKPKCDWMKGAFQDRRDKRREEMNGLLESKASLAGAKAKQAAQQR